MFASPRTMATHPLRSSSDRRRVVGVLVGSATAMFSLQRQASADDLVHTAWSSFHKDAYLRDCLFYAEEALTTTGLEVLNPGNYEDYWVYGYNHDYLAPGKGGSSASVSATVVVVPGESLDDLWVAIIASATDDYSSGRLRDLIRDYIKGQQRID